MPVAALLMAAKAAHLAEKLAKSAWDVAVDARRASIRAALDAGASPKEVADVLGLQPQRVAQLAKERRAVGH